MLQEYITVFLFYKKHSVEESNTGNLCNRSHKRIVNTVQGFITVKVLIIVTVSLRIEPLSVNVKQGIYILDYQTQPASRFRYYYFNAWKRLLPSCSVWWFYYENTDKKQNLQDQIKILKK